MWVTLFASQPSESMLTDTTQRTFSPGVPSLPTVDTIRRSSSAASFLVAFGSSLSAAASRLESMRNVTSFPLALDSQSENTCPCP